MFWMRKNCLELLFRGEKLLDLQDKELMDYVDKKIKQAQERHDRFILRKEEEANRRQLELDLAAIKDKEETARQTAKEQGETTRKREQEETARQKELKETKRQVEKNRQEEETKRQAHAQAQGQASAQQDDGHGIGQGSRVGHKPSLPKLPAFREKIDDIDSYLFRFEAHATALKWDKAHWVTYLSALLDGTALTLFRSLSDTEGEAVTYDKLKSTLLKKF